MVKLALHLGDLHIRTLKYHDEYKESFISMMNQFKELSVGYDREEVRIVLCGDIFHQKNVISNEQIIFGGWLFKELEKIAPLIVIAGNHDMIVNNKNRLDSITPIVQFLPDANINYFKESKCYLDNNIVWCVYSVFEDNVRPDIESARLEFGNDKTYIGLFHGALNNATTDIGFSIEHGVNLDIFDGCNAVFMADIHKYQIFNSNGVKAIYSSSCLQQNFGESINSHGFVLWDLRDLSHKFYEIENKYKFYTFKIKSLDDLENNKELLTNL